MPAAHNNHAGIQLFSLSHYGFRRFTGHYLATRADTGIFQFTQRLTHYGCRCALFILCVAKIRRILTDGNLIGARRGIAEVHTA